MDDAAIAGVAFRLTAYTILFYLVSRWAWEGERDPSWIRGFAYAVLRVAAGASLGALIEVQIREMGGEFQLLQAVLFVAARLFSWVLLLGLLGARTYRLAVGVAGGMLINLAADAGFSKPVLAGFPLYC